MGLKIIIFDGTFKTTPFINRLIKDMAKKHIVYVLGFNEMISKPINGVTYISLGSNQNSLRFVFTTLKILWRGKKFSLIPSTIKKIVKGDRVGLQRQNLDLNLRQIAPDIIHLQWPSVISWFEDTLLKQEIPIILSQRGFHNNVRPFVDKDNFEYLQKWYPKMAGFHSVSKAISKNGDELGKDPSKRDCIIYTGINLEKFTFLEVYSRSQPLKIISVGRAHWIKGYDYALQSCKLLKEKGVSFQYTIIGGTGEELQFLVDNLGLKNYVVMEKRKPQMEVFRLMQEASLLLMPSLEEGIPNVVVEAMAIGLPVISTNCGGVVELISTEKEGWIVPIREPQAMTEAIEAFVNLPLQKIEEVRLAARKKVEQQHSLKQMIEGMEALYYEVVDLKKS